MALRLEDKQALVAEVNEIAANSEVGNRRRVSRAQRRADDRVPGESPERRRLRARGQEHPGETGLSRAPSSNVSRTRCRVRCCSRFPARIRALPPGHQGIREGERGSRNEGGRDRRHAVRRRRSRPAGESAEPGSGPRDAAGRAAGPATEARPRTLAEPPANAGARARRARRVRGCLRTFDPFESDFASNTTF